MKHTPGPWAVEWITRNMPCVSIETQTMDEAIANVYLKAAAPELYEACMMALNTVEDRDTRNALLDAVLKAKPPIAEVEAARSKIY